MTTIITVHEAETHLDRYLDEVEQGREFTITCHGRPVAMLMPVNPSEPMPSRPKVGETLGPPFTFPDFAFAPLTEEELKEWGL